MKDKILLVLMCVLMVVSACDSDNNANVDIVFSPEKLMVADYDSIVKLFVATQPKIKTKYVVEELPEWLNVTPKKGFINGNVIELDIKPQADSLKQGLYKGLIKIKFNNLKVVELEVNLSVKQSPRLSVNTNELHFSAAESEKELILENIGHGFLYWSSSNLPDFLSMYPVQGFLPSGMKANVKVTVKKHLLEPQVISTRLVFNTSNSQLFSIPVNVVVPAIFALETKTKSVIFDYFEQYKYIYLKNLGNQTINWSSKHENYFNLKPNSGTLLKGDSVKIAVDLNRKDLQSGNYNSDIVFSAQDKNISISSTVKHFAESKMHLSINVIDAEFCKKTNKIITISTNPNVLSIIDPITNTVESIALNLKPNCLAVNSTNSKAVVGHYGKVSIIDLTSKKLVKEYDVLCDVFDILLTTSDWVYACPGYYSHANRRLYCLNLNSGIIMLSTSFGMNVSYTINAKLDPTESFIYGVSYGVFPSNMHKLDIRNGVAEGLYSSPYHGEYEMSDDLWMPEDGNKIFTKGKSVFEMTQIKATDMNFISKIQNSYNINYLSHSSVNNKVYLVNNINNVVFSYKYSDLSPSENYTLENFLIRSSDTSATLYNAIAKYVFVNAAGTKLYAITNIVNSSIWAIQTINLN